MKQWYVVVNGGQSGPFTQQQLTEQIAARTVRLQDLIWTDGMADWLPAGQVAEFAQAMSASDKPTSPGRAVPVPPTAQGPLAASVLPYATPRSMMAVGTATIAQVRPDNGPFLVLGKMFVSRNGPWVGTAVASPQAIYLHKRKRPGIGTNFDDDPTRTCSLAELPPAVQEQLDTSGKQAASDVVVIPRESVKKVKLGTLEQQLRVYAGPYLFGVAVGLFKIGTIRSFLTGNGWKLNTDLVPTMDYPFGKNLGQVEPVPSTKKSGSAIGAAVGGIFFVIAYVLAKTFAQSLFRKH